MTHRINIGDRSKDHIVIFERKDGKYDWHRVSESGRIISGSENQGYENQPYAIAMAEALNGTELPQLFLPYVPVENI